MVNAIAAEQTRRADAMEPRSIRIAEREGHASLHRLSPQDATGLARVLDQTAANVGRPPDYARLAADVGQIGLDIAGIFDPTPISDGTNALVSVFRGNFGDAGLSALGMIPYIGDAAKLGKLGSWARTVHSAVEAAGHSAAFRRTVEPALRALSDAIGAVPDRIMRSLPASARDELTAMKSSIDGLLARAAPGGRTLDEIAPNGRVPSVTNHAFADWFDDLNPAEFDRAWADPAIREKIEARIRHPGGLHEWSMVSETPKFKEWGFTMDGIKEFRSRIADLSWTHPVTGEIGRHGGPGSGAFHRELREMIRGAEDPAAFRQGVDALLERWKIDPDILPD